MMFSSCIIRIYNIIITTCKHFLGGKTKNLFVLGPGKLSPIKWKVVFVKFCLHMRFGALKTEMIRFQLWFPSRICVLYEAPHPFSSSLLSCTSNMHLFILNKLHKWMRLWFAGPIWRCRESSWSHRMIRIHLFALLWMSGASPDRLRLIRLPTWRAPLRKRELVSDIRNNESV